jgi:hypothetical protein
VTDPEPPVTPTPVDAPLTAKQITAALARPFDEKEVKFKPAVVKNNKAMALAYVDARVVQDRLDDVLGVEGWSDEYEFLPDGSCLCRLRCRIADEWLTKMDVGSPSEQPDQGDRTKAAVSDALKRAAVKFGVGRYLYRMPQQWVDYDSMKRQFVRPPQLPSFARPNPLGKGADNLKATLQKSAADQGAPILDDQVRESLELKATLGFDDDQFFAGLKAKFPVAFKDAKKGDLAAEPALRKLTAAQAIQLLDALKGKAQTAAPVNA